MERAQFEEEKAKILEKALAGLDQITSNLNVLNRNIETINSIGTQFEAPAQLWSSFHTAVGATASEKQQYTEQQSQQGTLEGNSDAPVSIGENERI